MTEDQKLVERLDARIRTWELVHQNNTTDARLLRAAADRIRALEGELEGIPGRTVSLPTVGRSETPSPAGGHRPGCRWLRARLCAVGIECEHGFDVCPQCDPCDCGESYQERVRPWMTACFGEVIPFDKVERGDRLLEEVFELLQSGGYDPERVLALRDYVWGRPVGDPPQEVGGVMVTLAAYCNAFGLDMYEAGETELSRIWTKVEAIRAKQAAKPTGSALPIGVSADASERREAETLAAGEGSRETPQARAERLQAQVEELREGLRPFAAFAPRYQGREFSILGWTTPTGQDIYLDPADFRRAHSLLSKQEKEG